jgi:hypothetical protein
MLAVSPCSAVFCVCPSFTDVSRAASVSADLGPLLLRFPGGTAAYDWSSRFPAIQNRLAPIQVSPRTIVRSSSAHFSLAPPGSIKRARTHASVWLHQDYADHGYAATDHIELARRSAAYVDNATTAKRAAIRYAHDSSLSVAEIRNQHVCAKGQYAMSRSKSRWAGHLAACGAAATIERSYSVFSARRSRRHRKQSNCYGQF